MPGPFPGMDPYIEFQARWPDFHNALIAEIRGDLGARLPDSYIARVDERIEVVTAESDSTTSYRPEILIARFDAPQTTPGTKTGTTIATIAPQLVEWSNRDPEEFRITWVEIRALPQLDLVTAIEVLSPIYKFGHGRQTYLDKRDTLQATKVNLVEIDLLLAGSPLPTKPRIDPGAYYALVTQASRVPQANLFRWTIRDLLPQLPIPLRDPDPPINIDLAILVTRVYNLGRYARTLRHSQPIPDLIPLSPYDREWAQRL